MKFSGIAVATAVAIGGWTMLAGKADALSVTCDFGQTPSADSAKGKGGGGGQQVTYGVDLALDAACIDGNDTNQIDSDFVLFGDTGWMLADKNDGNDGDGVLSFLTAPINGNKSGAFEIDNPDFYQDVVLTLKAGSSFAAFLLDGLDTDYLSGLWYSSKDLSHASIYYRGEPTPPAPIPLPAGGVLLGSALLGVVALRRRAKA